MEFFICNGCNQESPKVKGFHKWCPECRSNGTMMRHFNEIHKAEQRLAKRNKAEVEGRLDDYLKRSEARAHGRVTPRGKAEATRGRLRHHIVARHLLDCHSQKEFIRRANELIREALEER
jgi:hypothetical protein